MTIQEELKRKAELVKALKTVSTMTPADIAMAVSELIMENQKLKTELQRVKEDKAENEAMYERVIKQQRETIDALKSETFKKMLEKYKPTLEGDMENEQ